MQIHKTFWRAKDGIIYVSSTVESHKIYCQIPVLKIFVFWKIPYLIFCLLYYILLNKREGKWAWKPFDILQFMFQRKGCWCNVWRVQWRGKRERKRGMLVGGKRYFLNTSFRRRSVFIYHAPITCNDFASQVK